ncbi:MAG: sensor histidine kinase [Acidimicrobiales bacterium]
MQASLRHMARWWNATVGEVASGLVVTVVLVAGAYGEAHPNQVSFQRIGGHPLPHTPDAALALVALAGLALVVRRRRPVAALTVSVAAVVVYTALGYVNGAALVAPAFAVYAMAARLAARAALAVTAATMVVLMGVTGALQPFGPTGGGFDLIPILVVAPCLGGIAVASRRAYVESIRLGAEQQARAQVDEERLRIARELHDVVAHTMATINVQAGVAAHLLADRADDPARDTLLAIKAASKQGLAELRAVLNVLRQAGAADPTEPAPGMDRLPALADGATAAGVPTRVVVTGSPVALPAPVELAAYRLVQESLTNAIRHAGPATATVNVSYEPGGLRVEVADDGRGVDAPPSADGSGHGLVGMRERAASVGGSVEAGPAPGGGWRVAAWLPAAGEAAGEGAGDAPDREAVAPGAAVEQLRA